MSWLAGQEQASELFKNESIKDKPIAMKTKQSSAGSSTQGPIISHWL